MKNDPRLNVPDPLCGAVFPARRVACAPRALSCYNFDRWVQRKITHRLCTGGFNSFGILAGYGGDILSPQTEVPFFYPCGVNPLVQHGTSIL